MVRDQVAHDRLAERWGDALCGVAGDHARRPTRLPVAMLFDARDRNIASRLAWWRDAKTPYCTGDGVSATREGCDYAPCGHDCPDYLADGGCRASATLGVMLRGLRTLGGVYTFSTKGIVMISGMYASLDMIGLATGGRLAGLPLWLRLTFRRATPGGVPTMIPVVVIEYDGEIDDLRAQLPAPVVHTAVAAIEPPDDDPYADDPYEESLQPATQPATQRATQTAPQPAPQPETCPQPRTATQPAPQPVQQPAPQPATQPAPQPVQQPAPQPAPQQAPQPAPQQAPQPAPQPADTGFSLF